MTPTRREFIKGIGIAIAGLVLARCGPWPRGDTSARGRLRDCWLRFDWLAEETRKAWSGGENEYARPRDQLYQEHRAALDELVAAGELPRAVADELEVGFIAAINHVWRSHVPITCYEPMVVDYAPTSAAQLVQQAKILEQMAGSGSLDAETVAAVQETIGRDIAFHSLTDSARQALYQDIKAGGLPLPDFAALPIDISLEEAAAATFLVELLLEGVR